MATRSLNKVQLIGNLTRDPELRYTPQGTAVCTFGLATNRQWNTDTGEKKEEAEFHKIVSWNKLAEICSQLLSKGRRIYVDGRLSTRSWTGQDGQQRQTTEIVISDMIILDSKGVGGGETIEVPENLPGPGGAAEVPEVAPGEDVSGDTASDSSAQAQPTDDTSKTKPGKAKKGEEESEDIPF